MDEYVVQFKTARQISPDDWETVTPSLKVNADTSIQDILEWARDVHRAPHVKQFTLTILE